MTLIIPPAVIKQMKTMPQTDQARIIEALEQIATQPSFRFSFMTELVGTRPRARSERHLASDHLDRKQ